MPELRRRVRGILHGLEPHVVETGIDDALVKYVGEPSAYDVQAGSLGVWLAAIAVNMIRDDLRKVSRRHRWELESGIDLSPVAASIQAVDPDRERQICAAQAQARMRLLRLATNDAERALLEARLDESDLDGQAKAVAAVDGVNLEGRVAIKRILERLRQRGRRAQAKLR
jgi:DNA-directed RNA polymerase specialized sigma24 family protein